MDWGEFVERGVFDTFFEWIVPAVSLMLLALVTGLVRLQVEGDLLGLVHLLLPALFVGLIVWQGLELHESDLPGRHRRTVARWYALGIYTMVGLSGWTVLLSVLGPSAAPRSVEALTEVVAGGLFGLLVGVSQVRARQSAEEATQAKLEQEFLERQQETNEVLNRILRHHLLNSLTVIRGQAEIAAEHVDAEGQRYIATVQDQTDEMTATIEEIRDITRTLTEDPELVPVDLATVLERQVERAREDYPEATFVLNTTPPEVPVRGNDLLGRAVENVLNNAVDHNTATEPRIEVDVTDRPGSVLVTVADNGPGVPDDQTDRLLEASERGIDSDGEGLGLFLTRSILDQYDGDIVIENREPAGIAVRLELPKAGG